MHTASGFQAVVCLALTLLVACSGGDDDRRETSSRDRSDAGVPKHSDAGTSDACVPKTCETGMCGQLDDGCGETLACGTCPTGQTCGGGGQENVCGGCTPESDNELCLAGQNLCQEYRLTDRCGAQRKITCGGCGDRVWAQWPINEHPQLEGDPALYDLLFRMDPATGLKWYDTYGGAAWGDAPATCASVNVHGYTGWRVPTPAELMTIVDHSSYHASDQIPYLSNDGVWTSLDDPMDPTRAFSLDSGDGHFYTPRKGELNRVLCVLSPTPDVTRTSGAPPGRFSVTTGTVKDNVTKVLWQRDPTEDLRTYAEATAYCSGLEIEGISQWRLPTPKELLSIPDFRVDGTTLDSAFRFITIYNFWTLAQAQEGGQTVYWSGFWDGALLEVQPGDVLYARCVHDP